MKNFDQNFENFPFLEERASQKKLILEKRKLFFLGLFLLIILLVIALLKLFSDYRRDIPSSSLPIVTSPPTPTLYKEIESQSFWATNSGVLKIEEELKNIEKELDNTDIKEKSLMPPVLDWKIKI